MALNPAVTTVAPVALLIAEPATTLRSVGLNLFFPIDALRFNESIAHTAPTDGYVAINTDVEASVRRYSYAATSPLPCTLNDCPSDTAALPNASVV